MRVSSSIDIPESELTERFLRADGPGGQNRRAGGAQRIPPYANSLQAGYAAARLLPPYDLNAVSFRRKGVARAARGGCRPQRKPSPTCVGMPDGTSAQRIA